MNLILHQPKMIIPHIKMNRTSIIVHWLKSYSLVP